MFVSHFYRIVLDLLLIEIRTPDNKFQIMSSRHCRLFINSTEYHDADVVERHNMKNDKCTTCSTYYELHSKSPFWWGSSGPYILLLLTVIKAYNINGKLIHWCVFWQLAIVSYCSYRGVQNFFDAQYCSLRFVLNIIVIVVSNRAIAKLSPTDTKGEEMVSFDCSYKLKCFTKKTCSQVSL